MFLAPAAIPVCWISTYAADTSKLNAGVGYCDRLENNLEGEDSIDIGFCYIKIFLYL